MIWVNADGSEMRPEDWANANIRCFGMLMDGRARVSGVPVAGTEVTLLLVLNGHHDRVEVTLPHGAGGARWQSVLDTTDLARGASEHRAGSVYPTTGRSVVLFRLLP